MKIFGDVREIIKKIIINREIVVRVGISNVFWKIVFFLKLLDKKNIVEDLIVLFKMIENIFLKMIGRWRFDKVSYILNVGGYIVLF